MYSVFFDNVSEKFILNGLILMLCQVGDLVGTSLLAVAFIVLEQVGDLSLENLEVGHHGHGLENSTLAANLTTTLHTVLTNDLH